MADGSLVGTHQPPLEKGNDTVGARQQVFAFSADSAAPFDHDHSRQHQDGWQPIRSHVLPGSMD